MKPNRASLLLPLLTFLFSIALSGCYTQLAFVDDEQYTSVELIPPVIIIMPIEHPTPIGPVWPINPIPIDPPSSPIIYQLPQAGYSPVMTKAPEPPPKRVSGYQRPGQSENTPITTVSNSDRRPTGLKRGGQ